MDSLEQHGLRTHIRLQRFFILDAPEGNGKTLKKQQFSAFWNRKKNSF